MRQRPSRAHDVALVASLWLCGCAGEATAGPGASAGVGTTAGGQGAAAGEGGAGGHGAADPGAGGDGGRAVELPDPLGPLAPVNATSTERFETSRACNQCHYASSSDAMHDPVSGEDISPGFQWRSSMMAFAARDPYYLAVVSEELEHAGDGEARRDVEAACLRCHAPAGSEEAHAQGEHLALAHVLTGGSPAANLGRDGVTCSLCHQIEDGGLGTPETFSGAFTIGDDRLIYGPHASPYTQPMEFFLGYTPVQSEHIARSSLCATCHTVITPAPGGGEFVEQATFLEWENSSHAASTSCGGCHLPSVDASGAPITTPIATYPEDLAPRSRYGVHSFVGANAYMLALLGDNIEWTGSTVPASELHAAAERSKAHLATAAILEVAPLEADGDAIVATITIHNQTGHKLPTGYPGRRLWIHLRALGPGGTTAFESGAWDGGGRLIDAGGALLDVTGVIHPHRDVVAPGEVQVWEAVPGDASDAPTHRPLAAIGYLKDDRILPSGWTAAGPWADQTAPVGVAGDASFAPGSDQVKYRIPDGAGVERVEVALVYQTVPPSAVEHLGRVPTPAAVKLTEMIARRPSEAHVIATAERDR